MSEEPLLPCVHLIRHGETTWSLSGLHTSRTDLPLTTQGEQEARQLGERLRETKFAAAITSPLIRARRTCELAGLGSLAESDPGVQEWDYGDYEGKTSAEIWQAHTNWNLFCDGCPGGESPLQLTARVDAFADRLRMMRGNVAVFSHGHFLRVLAARWIGMPVRVAQHLSLGTASLSILDFEHRHAENPVIALWNELPVR